MVPILLFGSQEDRSSKRGRVTAARHPGVLEVKGLGAEEEGGRRGAQERTGILRKRWEINNLKAAALPFSLHFPLKRLSNQFAPRNMLIANGAH